MTFNIGQQQAGTINNVSGNQQITGGQTGVWLSAADLEATVSALRAALTAADLPAPVARAAAREVAEVEASVRAGEPDRPRAAGALERLCRLLTSVGSVVGPAAALVTPISTLAHWLGPLGLAALRLMGQA